MTTLTKLVWNPPDVNSTYNNTLIYSSTSKYGTYTLLTTLTNIRTTFYIDLAGTPTTWYKIRFNDTVNGIYSDYSSPIPANGVIGDLNYTTPKQVAEYLNRYRTVTGEAVDTLTSETVCAAVADPKVVADSETVYVAGTAKVRNADYTMNYDTGVITFTASTTGAVTADYWADSTVVNSRVVSAIRRAEDEINRKTGRKFYQIQQVTEFIDSFDTLATDIRAYSYITLDENVQEYKPNTNTPLLSRVIQLENYPVDSMLQVIVNAQPTSVMGEAVGTGAGVVLAFTLDYNPVVYGSEIVYVAGAQVTNYTINNTTGVITFTAAPTGAITCDYQHCTHGTVLSSDYYLLRDESGILILKDTAEQIKRNPFIATVVYKYGYDEPPAVVQDLATRIAARVIFMSTLMGSPNPMEFTSANIAVMQRDIDALFDTIGRKMVMMRL